MNQQPLDVFCSYPAAPSTESTVAFQGIQESELRSGELVQNAQKKSGGRRFPGTELALAIMLLAWAGLAFSDDVITNRLCIATAIGAGLFCFRHRA